MIYFILQILKIVSIVRIFEFFSTVYFRRANLNNEINFQTLCIGQIEASTCPPRATPRAFDFFENYCSNAPLPGPKCRSNAPH